MENAAAARKRNWNEAEIALLVEQVEDKRDILKGKFSSSLTAADKSAAWTSIMNSINAIGGCGRTLKEVKKKWQDIQSSTKKREVERLKTQRQTGGGPPPTDIKDWEKKIIGIMSNTVVSGIAGGCDSLVSDSECAVFPIRSASFLCTEAVTSLEACNPEQEHPQKQFDTVDEPAKEQRQFNSVMVKNSHSEVASTSGTDLDNSNFNKKQSRKSHVQEKGKGDTSELLSIQREMVILMREDLVIKRKILTSFEEYVALKKKKLDLHLEEKVNGPTYFEL
ncbi:uncharacterized protein LOC134251883 isoform X1 [Saccostrea cucullata]|uniref:uncharacterized protein LOC134251883 isoform X1 n=1 Tax=Saccostrea cuccullata TaxID=36930 RepID=UPI002ED3A752